MRETKPTPQDAEPQTAPSDVAETTAVADDPSQRAVSLSETSGLDWWRDPQTGLEVTPTPRNVPAELIGRACEREPAVLIGPYDPALDEED